MTTFDFENIRTIGEPEDLSVDTGLVNQILQLESHVRQLQRQLPFAHSAAEAEYLSSQINSMAAEKAHLELNLNQASRAELDRLRLPSGGV